MSNGSYSIEKFVGTLSSDWAAEWGTRRTLLTTTRSKYTCCIDGAVVLVENVCSQDTEVLKQSNFVIRCLLDQQAEADVIVYREEFPDTEKHSFVVTLQPGAEGYYSPPIPQH